MRATPFDLLDDLRIDAVRCGRSGTRINLEMSCPALPGLSFRLAANAGGALQFDVPRIAVFTRGRATIGLEQMRVLETVGDRVAAWVARIAASQDRAEAAGRFWSGTVKAAFANRPLGVSRGRLREMKNDLAVLAAAIGRAVHVQAGSPLQSPRHTLVPTGRGERLRAAEILLEAYAPEGHACRRVPGPAFLVEATRFSVHPPAGEREARSSAHDRLRRLDEATAVLERAGKLIDCAPARIGAALDELARLAA